MDQGKIELCMCFSYKNHCKFYHAYVSLCICITENLLYIPWKIIIFVCSMAISYYIWVDSFSLCHCNFQSVFHVFESSKHGKFCFICRWMSYETHFLYVFSFYFCYDCFLRWQFFRPRKFMPLSPAKFMSLVFLPRAEDQL